MTYTALSEKGQVVIPKLIRNVLDLNPSDKLQVEIVSGRIILSPLPQINDVFGVFKTQKIVDKKRMKEIIKKHVNKKFSRSK